LETPISFQFKRIALTILSREPLRCFRHQPWVMEAPAVEADRKAGVVAPEQSCHPTALVIESIRRPFPPFGSNALELDPSQSPVHTFKRRQTVW
jgi:hypothetical protein